MSLTLAITASGYFTQLTSPVLKKHRHRVKIKDVLVQLNPHQHFNHNYFLNLTRLNNAVAYLIDQLGVVVQADIGLEAHVGAGLLRGDVDGEVLVATQPVYAVPARVEHHLGALDEQGAGGQRLPRVR